MKNKNGQPTADFFFQILEKSPKGVVVYDATLRCCYLNQKASDILEIQDKEEALGSSLEELSPGIEQTERYGKYLDTLRNGVEHHEYFSIEKDACKQFIRVESVLIDSSLVLYISDITDIVKKESVYLSTENWLNSLLSAIDIPVLFKNTDLKYIVMNSAMNELFGTDEEFTESDFNSKIIGCDKGFHSCEIEVMREEREKCNFEISLENSDGRVHDYSVVVVPIKDERNFITGLIEIFFDITEFKITNDELKLLAATVSHSSEGILITDSNGIIRYVNDAYEKLTGYTYDEFVGNNPSLVKSGVHSEKFYKHLWKKINRGELWEGLFVNKRKDGTLYRERAVIFPMISDETGDIKNFVAVKRDVTHEVELEEQFRHAQKMEAVGRLAGGIAHDFNNIMTSIQGYNEVLLMKIDATHNFYKPLTEIKKACKRAVALTRQLLTFSRKQVFYLKTIDLNKTIESMQGMLQRLIGENIILEIFLKSGKLLVKSDSSMLEQVIMNLVINAADACEDKSDASIVIKTDVTILQEPFLDGHFEARPGKYILMQVTDNGQGMDDDVKQRIFDPFFTTKVKNKGTGLGLSTVYGIIKQQNGYIQVESIVGQGTVFKIHLPLCLDSCLDMDTGVVRTQNVLKPGSGIIMVLEDDDSLRGLLESILKTAGYEILVASSSIELYEKFPDKGVDLLLADIILKGERGDDIAKKLKKENKDMKILFISGYVGKSISNVNFDIDDCEFIPKPFSISDLTAKIKQMLNPENPEN